MPELIALTLFIAFTLIVLWVIYKIVRRNRMSRSTIDQAGPAEKIPRRFRAGIQGTARDVAKLDTVGDYLSFRLERNDSDGNVIELIPIEIRGGVGGQAIRDGDAMVVLGRRNRRGLLIPKAVFNITSQLQIEVGGHSGLLASIFFLPMGLLFVISWPAVVFGISMMFSSREDEVNQGILLILGSFLVMIIFYFAYIRNRRFAQK